MPDFPKLPIITPPPQQQPQRPDRSFPDLPILEPDPPRMTLREKYGALYYFGIGGLIFSAYLIGSFFVGFYRMRHLWAAVLVLGNPTSSPPARYEAAWRLAHDPDANDLQRMTFAMNKDLPDLARYIIAEGLTTDAIQYDPKDYALKVARSEGWPDWLRIVVARPLAYAVGRGYRIAWEPLDEMRAGTDRALALWMTYARAAMGQGDEEARRQLRDAAAAAGPYQGLAGLLDAAAGAEDAAARDRKLDEATAWLRAHHPPCAKVWEGWEVRDGELAIRPEAPATGAAAAPGPPASTPGPASPAPPRPSGTARPR